MIFVEFWTQKPLTGFVWCQLHLVINGRFHLLDTYLVVRSAQSCTEKVKGKTDAIHSFFIFVPTYDTYERIKYYFDDNLTRLQWWLSVFQDWIILSYSVFKTN